MWLIFRRVGRRSDGASSPSDAARCSLRRRRLQHRQSTYVEQVSSAPQSSSASQTSNTARLTTEEIFAAIEKLAALHAKGILTDDEFGTKKAELLGRL